MEKGFSVQEMSGNNHLWSEPAKESSGMNRSESEWAFHRFLQESSDASAGVAATASVSGPSSPVDSHEYREILKSKLNLACAAVVAMKRVKTLISLSLSLCSCFIVQKC